MKKKKIIIIVSIIVILIAAGFTVYKLTKKTNDNKTVDVEKNKKQTGYTFKSQDGEKITIKADKLVTATGFAGASNYKYYLRGTTLYFRDISSSKNEEEILAYNVKDIYLDGDMVVAELQTNGNIVKENSHITYKKQNEYKEVYKLTTQDGKEITINADKLVTAKGFAGASNHVFYLKGQTLYYRNISTESNKEELLAYNINDISVEGDMVIATKQSNSEIITENNYITYR